MSEMKVGLSVRAEGKQAQRELQQTAEATQNLGRATRDVGKAAQTAGAQVKQAASAQAAAIRQAAAGTADALADVKRSGGAAGNAIKRGMQDGVREERRAGEEADRLGDRIKRMLRRVGDSGGVFRIMGRAVRSELKHIKSAIDSTMGKLAALGVGFKTGQAVVASARLDRALIRTRQTADMTPAQQADLRTLLFQLGRSNGNDVDRLREGFDTFVASGLSYQPAKEAIKAVDVGSTISDADPTTLARGLLVGAKAFNFDLAEPGRALDMLEKMIVAGRAGNAELENLSDIFARIGPNATRAGLGFEQTLALVETLSGLEMQPERLATLGESTLRLWSNANYMRAAEKATHVRFFNQDGSRRDIVDVLADLKGRYDKLGTDRQRMRFISAAFGHADLDTQKGIQFLLTGNNLQTFRGTQQQVAQAHGVASRDLAENRASATAVAGRMRNTLGEAIDRMAQPINKAFADAGSYLLDDLNLSGEQLIGGTFVAGLGAHSLGRFGKYGLGKISKWLDGGTDTLRNIAVGRALHDATGVLPVFVTNWSGAPAAASGGTPSVVPTGTAAKVIGGAVVPITVSSAIAVTAVQRESAIENAIDSGKWRAGGRYASLQPLDERRHLTPEEVSARQAVMQGMPFEQWRAQHGDTRGWWQRLNEGPRDDYLRWVASQAAKLDSPAAGKSASPDQVQQVTAALDAARRAFESILGKPLRIEVTSDTPELHAKVVQRAEREARRG
ncbi:phage-related tail protein [Mizugakiibacter sediminis]|uniref:Phage tail protein n=1 Tax=Mizugakiibacter sediminis TaxID=1475481 RepID=A0A0K8QNI7_9GAMM|nr:phage tail tape measure protein [Mizugakiibacter sediminis]GAP66261.1 phage-related tail protein [Mizugakiibacter sediminis]